jgi:tetratricopeptide (TPR) repeat protein
METLHLKGIIDMDIYRALPILFLLLFAQATAAQIYKWVDDDGNVSFSDRPQPDKRPDNRITNRPRPTVKPPEPESASDNPGVAPPKQNAVALPPVGTITLTLRHLLRVRKYDELNAVLAGYQAAVEENIANEEALFTAYDTFDVQEKSYETLLNDWVAATPDAYQPYMARARFLHRMAWQARGTKWASETSREQFEQMNAYFALASKDLDVVLRKKPELMVAYSQLIGMMSTAAEHEKMLQVMQVAIGLNPATYHVRLTYLNALTPRWGGSYELMKAFVEKSQDYAHLNPRLKSLAAKIYLEAGDRQSLAQAYSQADKLYTEALAYGENHAILKERGENNYRRKKYDEALPDLNRAIELYPENGTYFHWRSKTYAKLKQYHAAVEDMLQANLLAPGDEAIASQRKSLVSTLERKGFDEYKARKLAEAVKSYELGLKLDPLAPWLYYRRAKALIDLNEYDQALADTRQALALDRDEYNFYLLVDWLLIKRNEYDQIISYWDEYIARHPDDSRAYLERGGTYYHKGDLKEAVRNAKIAADMGNAEAQKAYERFSRRLR